MADSRPPWMQGWPSPLSVPTNTDASPQSPSRGKSVAEMVSEGYGPSLRNSRVGSLRSVAMSSTPQGVRVQEIAASFAHNNGHNEFAVQSIAPTTNKAEISISDLVGDVARRATAARYLESEYGRLPTHATEDHDGEMDISSSPARSDAGTPSSERAVPRNKAPLANRSSEERGLSSSLSFPGPEARMLRAQEPLSTLWHRQGSDPSEPVDMNRGDMSGRATQSHVTSERVERVYSGTVPSVESGTPAPYAHMEDPYLEKLKTSVAALSEVTRKLREGGSLGEVDMLDAHGSGRTMMLDAERESPGLRSGVLIARGDREDSSSETGVDARDKIARTLIENASLQFRHNMVGEAFASNDSERATSSNSNRSFSAASAAVRREGERAAFARLTMVLNHDYASLVPADTRGREVLKQHLAESLGAALRVSVSRVRVLQLRPGSVIVDLSIRPDENGEDWRSGDELLHELQLNVNKDSSELNILWRVASVQHTRHFDAAAAGEEALPSPISAALDSSKIRSAAMLPTTEAAVSRSLVQRVFGTSQAAGASRMLPPSGPTPTVTAPAPTEAGGASALFQQLEEEKTGDREAPDVPLGLLEVVVYEAANLPTDEWTRAFCVLKLTERLQGHTRSQIRQSEIGMESLVPEEVSMATFEASEMGVGWQSLSGQVAHRTEVVEGIDPQFCETFRFPVSDPSSQQLRAQLLHKGFMATEFVGEVIVGVGDAIHHIHEHHAACKSEEENDAAEAWYPLRTVTGGRVRNRLGYDSELSIGFRWISPPPSDLVVMRGNLHKKKDGGSEDFGGSPAKGHMRPAGGALVGRGSDWQKRTFTLDPYSQVLREYMNTAALSRTHVREAVVEDVSLLENRAHTFRIQTGAVTMTCSAEDAGDFEAWMTALRAASGLRVPDNVQSSYQGPQMICIMLVLLLAAVALAVGLPLWFHLRPSPVKPYPLVHNWTQCAPKPMHSHQVSGPAAADHTKYHQPLVACELCECFQRCMYATTFGLQAPSVSNLPHVCGLECLCKVPGPKTKCGDGDRLSHTVDWYGTSIAIDEECDDGNVANGDGCDHRCKVENFMSTSAAGHLVAGRSKTLCGRGHTLTQCETACIVDEACKSVWYGDGWCHMYERTSPLVTSQPALGRASSLFVSDWDEVEYACGTGKFEPARSHHQIRASVVLFGVDHFNNHSHAQAFRDIFHVQPFCDASCTLQLLSTVGGLLPFRDFAENSLPVGRRTDVPVVTVAFKLVVHNATSQTVAQQMTAFVNRGENGLWGRLKELRAADGQPQFTGLLGTMFERTPYVAQQPAPPLTAGTLFTKTRFNCVKAADVPVRLHAPAATADLCCGNLSQVCAPVSRCYVSSQMHFGCVPKRTPFAPTGLQGTPLDERVALLWNNPHDTGGLFVDHYVISKAKFVVGKDVTFEALHPTPSNQTRFDVLSLENFVPYYFEVHAVNAFGMGPASARSASLEPWIFAPSQPINGRGASGNKRVWLAWDPPRTDGGRAIEEFELWITNGSGLARAPPVWWRLHLAPEGNVTTGNVPPGGVYPIAESSLRSDKAFSSSQKPGSARSTWSMQTSFLRVASTKSAGTASADRDPRSLVFLVAGDADHNPLHGSEIYSFRVRAKNSYDVSRWSTVVAVLPTGEAPGPPTKVGAMCHTSNTPVFCKAGIAGDAQIRLVWEPPLADGGSPITGYIVMYGDYALAMASPVGVRGSSMQHLSVAVRSHSPITTFTIPGLTNDADYLIVIEASNKYGNSSRVLAGPFTPKSCQAAEDVSCSACTEPYFNIWQGCKPPPCISPSSSEYADSLHTRLRSCTSQGCRLEVFHGTPELGQWGTVSVRSFTQTSAAVACRSLGLRARPEACGGAGSTCGGVEYPVSVQGSGIVWLEGVNCIGTETKIHDCPAGMRARVDAITGEYALTKWGLPQEKQSHEIDVGLCCWAPLPPPPFSPTDVIVTMALKLPMSVADLNPGKQTVLRQAIATAAQVPDSKVNVAAVEPIARRRRSFVTRRSQSQGAEEVLSGGVGVEGGRHLLGVSIRVDLEIATPDKSAAEAVADELTPVTINVHLQNAGLPLAEVSILEEASPPPPPPTAPIGTPAPTDDSDNVTSCGGDNASNSSNTTSCDQDQDGNSSSNGNDSSSGTRRRETEFKVVLDDEHILIHVHSMRRNGVNLGMKLDSGQRRVLLNIGWIFISVVLVALWGFVRMSI